MNAVSLVFLFVLALLAVHAWLDFTDFLWEIFFPPVPAASLTNSQKQDLEMLTRRPASPDPHGKLLRSRCLELGLLKGGR